MLEGSKSYLLAVYRRFLYIFFTCEKIWDIRIMNEKLTFSIFWCYPLDHSSLVLLFIYINILLIWARPFHVSICFVNKDQLDFFFCISVQLQFHWWQFLRLLFYKYFVYISVFAPLDCAILEICRVVGIPNHFSVETKNTCFQIAIPLDTCKVLRKSDRDT